MKVQFLKDTRKIRGSETLPQNTLVIFRDGFGYGVPEIPGAEYIEFLEYKKRYTLFEPSLIVVVGLNRIITPSNRCDMVNEYLQTMTPNIPKISVDTAPFIGEPWRLWFHYSIAACGYFKITYSYAIETEWKKWFYRDAPDCRISSGNIRLLLSDTVSDIAPLETTFDFVPVGDGELIWYEKLKQHIFNKYSTPKMLISGILKPSNRYFGVNMTYESYRENRRITLPDLPVFRFMAEENLRRMGIYNEVVRYGAENLHQ